MPESLQQPNSLDTVARRHPQSRRTHPSNWFVDTYRLAAPNVAQDREYWPEVERVILEKFSSGGNAESWKNACMEFRDKRASIFSLFAAYDREADARRESDEAAKMLEQGDRNYQAERDPEVAVMAAEFRKLHPPKQGGLRETAAHVLRAIGWMEAHDVRGDRRISAEREALEETEEVAR